MLKKWVYLFFSSTLWVCFFTPASALEQWSFEWGKSKEPHALSMEKLEERWMSFLLQECARSETEQALSNLGVAYQLEPEAGLFPYKFFGSLVKEDVMEEDLEILCKGKGIDFSEKFEAIKGIWKEWVRKQKQKVLSSDWFEELMSDGTVTYSEFLEHSECILQNLHVEDLIGVLATIEEVSIKKEELPINRISGHAFGQGYAMQSSFTPPKRGWEPANGGVKEGLPKSEEAKLFFDLPISEDDKANIRKILTTMADKNVLQLLMEKKSMEKRGDRIRPVHPMRFIGYALADPNLRRCLKTISKSTFKWNGFLDGYEKRLKEEVRSGQVNCYVPGLADLLEVEHHVIQSYFDRGDYQGMIRHFL